MKMTLHEYKTSIAMVEIYNEKVRDLLGSKPEGITFTLRCEEILLTLTHGMFNYWV